MMRVWFTPEDMEEIVWVNREEIERRLLEDGQIYPEDVGTTWLIDQPYVERLVLTLMGRLPDRATPPKDDAVQMLLRYMSVLVDHKTPCPPSLAAPEYFDSIRRELKSWEERVKPLLRAPNPEILATSFVQV